MNKPRYTDLSQSHNCISVRKFLKKTLLYYFWASLKITATKILSIFLFLTLNGLWNDSWGVCMGPTRPFECAQQLHGIIFLRGPWQWNQDLPLVHELAFRNPSHMVRCHAQPWCRGKGAWSYLNLIYQALLTPQGRPYSLWRVDGGGRQGGVVNWGGGGSLWLVHKMNKENFKN